MVWKKDNLHHSQHSAIKSQSREKSVAGGALLWLQLTRDWEYVVTRQIPWSLTLVCEKHCKLVVEICFVSPNFILVYKVGGYHWLPVNRKIWMIKVASQKKKIILK